jgi:hypothetical protein
MALYAEATFERGSGLGNRMFPWARARIFANANEIPLLAPKWVAPRIAPLLRSRGDLRAFSRQALLAGLFDPAIGDITGSRRASIARRATVHPEPVAFASRTDDGRGPGDHLVRFAGDLTGSGRFHSLEGYDASLRDEFHAITRVRWLELAAKTRDIPIGIHVRLGDFRSGAPEAHRNEAGAFLGAWRTPLQWYVEALRTVRELLAQDWPAFVVSDGSAEELGELLDVPDVTLVRSRNPASDMWSLADCRVLIGAIGSSFGAWASFLGQMPTVLYPLGDAHAFPVQTRTGAFNGMLDPAWPEDALVRNLASLK